jgi:hypothetical protein
MLMILINEKCDNIDSADENDDMRKVYHFSNFFLSN